MVKMRQSVGLELTLVLRPKSEAGYFYPEPIAFRKTPKVETKV